MQYKGNMTISSVHCKISVENHPETGVQVRIEDTSSNGTYVNTQHLGKHKSCQLSQNDEVRLLTNDAQNEHFGDFVYTFQARAPAASGSAIISRTLLIWRCRVALAGPYARPPRRRARPDVPRARAACTRPRAAVDEQSVQHGVRRDRLPALADRPAEDGRGDVDENPGKPECATAPPPRPRAALPPRPRAAPPPRRPPPCRPPPLARAPSRTRTNTSTLWPRPTARRCADHGHAQRRAQDGAARHVRVHRRRRALGAARRGGGGHVQAQDELARPRGARGRAREPVGAHQQRGRRRAHLTPTPKP